MFIWISIVSNIDNMSNILTVQYYLPGIKQVSFAFLKDVYANRKKVLKKKQVDYISVPHFQELSVKRLWPDLKDDKEFNVFFNDEFPEQKVPNREFFMNILNTIYPDYLKNIMSHASKERYAVDGEAMKEKTIEADPEWIEELKNMPFKSSKSISQSFN